MNFPYTSGKKKLDSTNIMTNGATSKGPHRQLRVTVQLNSRQKPMKTCCKPNSANDCLRFSRFPQTIALRKVDSGSASLKGSFEVEKYSTPDTLISLGSVR